MKRYQDEILIKRANTQLPYTIIYNYMLGNKNLSFEAKGLLCMMLSLPMNWVINKKWILKEFKIKRTMLDKSFKELEENGYLVSFDIAKAERGKFSGKGYLVYPSSTKYDDKDHYVMTGAATQHRKIYENTDVVLPYTVKQHLQTTEQTN